MPNLATANLMQGIPCRSQPGPRPGSIKAAIAARLDPMQSVYMALGLRLRPSTKGAFCPPRQMPWLMDQDAEWAAQVFNGSHRGHRTHSQSSFSEQESEARCKIIHLPLFLLQQTTSQVGGWHGWSSTNLILCGQCVRLIE